MKRITLIMVFLILAGVIVTIYIKHHQGQANAAASPSQSTGGMTLTDIHGKTVHVNPNRKTLVYFMAAWCGSCIEGERKLTTLEKDTKAPMLSIDVSPEYDKKKSIEQFIQLSHSHWPHVLDKNHTYMQQFHIQSLDTVVVLFHHQVIFKAIQPSNTKLKKVLAS